MPHEDEYLDLVNDDDEVIGKKLRSEVYAENLSNFRVVNAFLINSEGKLWFPRRTATKRMFPLCLDMSMGGHVESVETYEQAFKRELMEELEIDADQSPWKLLGHLTPQEHNVSANMNIYEITTDETPHYNQNDFIEFFWLTPQELFARIAAGEKTKEDLPKLVRHFYPSRPENSESLKLARQFLGRDVEVTIDRPLGSKHPKHGFVYEVNYGYVEGIKAPDGEDLDAYFLGVDEPLQKATGKCIAIVHRTDNDDDKLVVVPPGVEFSDGDILRAVHFQEQWFKSEIVRTKDDAFTNEAMDRGRDF